MAHSFKLLNNKYIRRLIFASIMLGCLGTIISKGVFLAENIGSSNASSVAIIEALSIELISLLIVAILAILIRWKSYFQFSQTQKTVSRLRKRIILAFGIGTAVPTIIITIFSSYFFNFGVQAWFDNKISSVLDQSLIVGKSYVDEHFLQLKDTAIAVSEDLNSLYYDLAYNKELFHQVLNAQAKLRSFDEAIVFERDTNNILAQTSFSFSLSFLTLPQYLLDKADKGEIVKVNNDRNKMRVLIKLKDYPQAYMLIGCLIERHIIDYIDSTKGSAADYQNLRHKLTATQIKFSVVFILFSLLLLMIALIWGRYFANKIVTPIKELVIAAEEVKNGNLSVRVPLEGLKKDEIGILSTVFNKMVEQIEQQQRDLIFAQRAAAWSDVARRVAHEIKNPLTPIQLSTERLDHKFSKEVSDKEMFNKYIQNILRNSNDIKNIVSEFVEFARLPAPIFVKCDIISLVQKLLESRELINEEIAYKFFSDLKKFELPCDMLQISRAVTNIVLNAEEALKSLKHDRKKIIDIKITTGNNNLSLIISDSGDGFSDELLLAAKQPYVTTKAQGTGLGLSIVDRIISDHFGKMLISNNEKGGGQIEILLDINALNNKI